MSGSITSFAKLPQRRSASLKAGTWYAPAWRASLEGGLAVTVAGAVVGSARPEWGAPVRLGLGFAWLACTAGTWAVAWGRNRSSEWFWRAFGGGVALRAAGFIILAAQCWSGPWQEAAALLGAYGFGLTAVMLLEFRHLVRDLR